MGRIILEDTKGCASNTGQHQIDTDKSISPDGCLSCILCGEILSEPKDTAQINKERGYAMALQAIQRALNDLVFRAGKDDGFGFEYETENIGVIGRSFRIPIFSFSFVKELKPR